MSTFSGSCDKSSVFSPLTRACETPYSIPREHGGWRPSCRGRRDGRYPDEHGRCQLYYVCHGEIFTGFHTCPGDTLFDPITGRCQVKSRVAYPCGDRDTPGLCRGKPDGRYLDAHGRCTHYYSCADGEAEGVFMCHEGVFNPETRTCDTSREVTSPCGSGDPNPCLAVEDGFHADPDAPCDRYHLCQSGLLSAVFSCEGDQVFDDVNHTCSDVMKTAPPCGLAATCEGKPDGRYPALNQGLDQFYTCSNGTVAGYGRCSRADGGLAFSAVRGRCDSPAAVCREVTGSGQLCGQH